jgi:hypothetical protein
MLKAYLWFQVLLLSSTIASTAFFQEGIERVVLMFFNVVLLSWALVILFGGYV